MRTRPFFALFATGVLGLGAAGCKEEQGFDARFRNEEERLQQSALALEQETAQAGQITPERNPLR